MTSQQVEGLKHKGYRPAQYVESSEDLREALDQIAHGCVSRGDKKVFRGLLDNLLNCDPFFVLADFADYTNGEIFRLRGASQKLK